MDAMDALLAHDIFLVIISITALIITAILIRALVFVLGILRNAKKISDEARREVHAIAQQADTIRRDLYEGERAVRPLLRAASRFFDGKKPSRRPSHPER